MYIVNLLRSIMLDFLFYSILPILSTNDFDFDVFA